MPTETAIKEDRFNAFSHAYRAALDEAVSTHPEEYFPYVVRNIHEVATKMLLAVRTGRYNHDGRGFKLACKALGIKHTRKAISAYLKGE